MFCLIDGKVMVGPSNTTESHLEWFKRMGWLTDETAEDFLRKNMRGFYLPHENKLYCYRDVGFGFDQGVLPEVIAKLEEFVSTFNLSGETEIYLGPKDSPIKGTEYSRVYVGKLKSLRKISYLEDDPIIIAALAVKISQTPFEQGDIKMLCEQCRANKTESRNLVNRVLKSQHLIFGDFLPFAIGLENLSRLAAVYLWRNVNALNLVFGAGIEASFRVIRPNRHNEVVADFGKMAFEAYLRAVNLGVPEQDARYMLPEGTLTRMVFSAPVRYLLKLACYLKQSPLEELREEGTVMEALINNRFGFALPEEKLSSQWPFWGEKTLDKGIFVDYRLKNHSISLTMRTEGSLAMYAQLVRQRQILCDIEPLEAIARKATFVVPPTFPASVKKDYETIAKAAHEAQMERINEGDPNFAYFLLLGQSAGATIYGKGAGVIETAKSRSEGVAQWEIRSVVGIPLVKELAKYEELRNQIGPRCWREKRCIEPATFKSKKAVCPSFARARGNWQGSLEDLMELLNEPYGTFKV